MIGEVFRAIFALGLPVVLLSWLIFRNLYKNGVLDRTEALKATEADLQSLRKEEDPSVRRRLLHSKWMQFGGGFYSLAALWTFVVIELQQAFEFVTSFPGMQALMQAGPIDFLVSLFVNQLQNFVQAIVWFRFWAPDGPEIGVWMIVAYVSYLVGTGTAKKMVVR